MNITFRILTPGTLCDCAVVLHLCQEREGPLLHLFPGENYTLLVPKGTTLLHTRGKRKRFVLLVPRRALEYALEIV